MVLKKAAFHLADRLLARRGLVLAPRGSGDTPARFLPAAALPRGYFEDKPFEGLIEYERAETLRMFTDIFPLYAGEYNSFPREPAGDGRFYLHNEFFGPVDAEVLYCLVRHLKPRTVIEVGSGYSSLLVRMALEKNCPSPGRLTCIDPSPRADVAAAADEHVQKPVEQVDVDIFAGLSPGDFLFVDSSHVVTTGGDLNHIFFKVLPTLAPGVLVHFHDICLPRDYLYDWVVTEGRSYTEQYLLLAFLSGNGEYEVLWPALHMMLAYPERVMEAFPSCTDVTAPVSFWMRKK